MKMSGKKLPFFPTPYPDELFYSVLCRYWLRTGRPAPRSTTEELYGVRRNSSILTPQYLERIASLLPEEMGVTSDYFLENTTIFPYFHPFLTTQRRETFRGYFKNSSPSSSSQYFALGVGKLRQPQTTHLRFCQSCWQDDMRRYGEPYWHRLHQLPGVLLCPAHDEPLMVSPVSFHTAKGNYYPADVQLINSSSICGSFSCVMSEKLVAIARDSEWLLKNGLNYGPYEETYARYARCFYDKGFGGHLGQVKHLSIYTALQEYFGEELLRLLNAYDESFRTSWVARIPHYQQGLQHPMYHILLTELLAGSTENFFKEDCPDILPFGQPPWSCHNPVCPSYLQDVISQYNADPYAGCMHARFECPVCGMVYRRKKAMSKEEQYSRRPKIYDYGPLWREKLRECLVDRRMTARETCNLMGCDFYTVNRHALRLGLLTPDEVYLLERKPRAKVDLPQKVIATEEELRTLYRKQWTELTEQNPSANRSKLIAMAPTCYKWLRENDVEWYEENSPPAKYTNFDWGRKDIETLEKLHRAYEAILNADGKPRWISRRALIEETGVFNLSNRKALEKMPETAAFLEKILESRESWQKRKIFWAIQKLQVEEELITPYKVLQKACVSQDLFHIFAPLIEEQIVRWYLICQV